MTDRREYPTPRAILSRDRNTTDLPPRQVNQSTDASDLGLKQPDPGPKEAIDPTNSASTVEDDAIEEEFNRSALTTRIMTALKAADLCAEGVVAGEDEVVIHEGAELEAEDVDGGIAVIPDGYPSSTGQVMDGEVKG